MRWAIIAGEYPPQVGGVSDYTRLVAAGLARCGDEVDVWAPACAGETPVDDGVRVHRLPGHYGLMALRKLRRDLDGLPSPHRLLVQYVPQAFGWKAMNLPFAGWLFSQRHRKPWVMFHEVVFPLSRGQSLKHNVLGLATHAMATLVARAADRSFVAIPEWATLVARMGGKREAIQLLPVPSNLPTVADPALVSSVRASFSIGRDAVLVGHFGTYGHHVGPMLADTLPPMLARDPNRLGLLLGRGGRTFADELVRRYPDLSGRIHATGGMSADLLAAHLAACEVLIQPYPDGASSRRGSLMGGLGLARPIVTTEGRLTEAHWKESGAVALVPASSPGEMIDAAEWLLTDAAAREALERRAAAAYKNLFAVENTVAVLRDFAAKEDAR